MAWEERRSECNDSDDDDDGNGDDSDDDDDVGKRCSF